MPRSSRHRVAVERARPSEDGRAEQDHAQRVESAILAAIPDAVVVTDVDGTITYWNDGAASLFGYTAAEMLGRPADVVYPPEDPDLPNRIGDSFTGEWRGLNKDGESVWIQLHAQPLVDEDGVTVGGIGIATDITERKQRDEERQWLATAVAQAAESVVITDRDARIVYVNPAFERLTGYSSTEVLGENPRILKSGVQSTTFYQAMWAALSSGIPWIADMTNRRKDGSLFQESGVFTPLKDEAGSITGYVAVKRDVTRERVLEAEGAAAGRERALIAETLRSLPAGMSPEATGSAVCRQVLSMAGLTHAHMFLFASDGRATPIGLATIDDHPVDARRLPVGRSRVLHAKASAGPWIEPWSPRNGHPFNQLIQDLQVGSAAYVPIGSGEGLIGILIAGTRGDDGTITLSAALPGLMEFASVAGTLLDPALTAIAAAASEYERIAGVIDQRAFATVFQPIVDLETDRPVGFEALSRFGDGTRPDLVFQAARRVNLGRELELAAIDSALGAARVLPETAFLSLNASPDLILAGSELSAMISGWEGAVVLEITEHQPIADYDRLHTALDALGPAIRLAVDDVGAGIANFDHLIGVRPQFIKVDIGLVRGVDADLARQALIVALLHFAETTGAQVIAEGIETAAELATLRRLGVRLGQGFYLGRPAEARTFTRRPTAPSRGRRATRVGVTAG